MTTTNTTKVITEVNPIVSYGFADALTALQPYLKEGYEIDLETNTGYPQQSGLMFTYSVNQFKLEPVVEPELLINLIADSQQHLQDQDNQGKEEQKDATPVTRRAKAKTSS